VIGGCRRLGLIAAVTLRLLAANALVMGGIMVLGTHTVAGVTRR